MSEKNDGGDGGGSGGGVPVFQTVSYRPPNDGGPAFPSDYIPGTATTPGMTLRDYFAGQALNGILLGHYSEQAQKDSRKAAVWSYEQADAMLAARGGAK